MNSNNLFDVHTRAVVIIGGGPAGCATALSLFSHSEEGSFLLLDDADPSTFKIGESLPPESSRLLNLIHPELLNDLNRELAAGRHLFSTGNASSWVSDTLDEQHAIMDPFGHGYHLNRAAFDELLRCSVKDYESKSKSMYRGIDVEKGRFMSVEKHSSGCWVICAAVDNEPRTFFAKWVVDATGRKASVATKLGARTITSHPLLAFYAVFTGPSLDHPNADNDHRTIVEATPDGWFYSSLLSQSPCTRVVAFHTLPTHPSAKCARRREGFLDLLHASAPHISTLIQQSDYEISPGGFPCCTAAGSSSLDRICDAADRWTAVGDSAMAFDPLSSQGMMTALEMGYYIGAALARLVADKGSELEEVICEEIIEMYENVRARYTKHRAYYYGAVKRFQGQEFWAKVACD